MKSVPTMARDVIDARSIDADLERLAQQMGNREPQFVVERHLVPGTIMWDVEHLPKVFVSPDVGLALRKRGFACAGMLGVLGAVKP